MTTIDVEQRLDEGRWGRHQKLLVLGTALAIVLDGIDNQLLGNAIPALMREWSLPRDAFTTALALGPLGMMIGGALGGVLGDRLGRRTALGYSITSFALLTLLTAGASDVTTLGILRFVAGLGLGGAMPNAAALASEYVPRRQRPFAVTLTIVCVPLGGAIAALMAVHILPAHGWRTLFVIGGGAPLVLAIALFKLLPESPRYLAGVPRRWPELVTLLRRFGHDVPEDAAFVGKEARQRTGGGAGLRALVAPGLRRDTVALFVAFLSCLLVTYVGILLIPATLTGAGFSQSVASNALGAWNIGGVVGALLGAIAIARVGSRTTMLSLSAVVIAVSLIMAALPLGSGSLRLLALFTVLGGALNAVQTTMYALAAHVYPTEVRGTGIGAAVAVGRIGNVLASYVGSYALDRGGVSGYFATFAIGMTIVFVALASVQRHIPAARVWHTR